VSEADLPPPDNPLDTEIGVAVEFDADEEDEEDERDVVVDEDEGLEDEEGECACHHPNSGCWAGAQERRSSKPAARDAICAACQRGVLVPLLCSRC